MIFVQVALRLLQHVQHHLRDVQRHQRQQDQLRRLVLQLLQQRVHHHRRESRRRLNRRRHLQPQSKPSPPPLRRQKLLNNRSSSSRSLRIISLLRLLLVSPTSSLQTLQWSRAICPFPPPLAVWWLWRPLVAPIRISHLTALPLTVWNTRRITIP